MSSTTARIWELPSGINGLVPKTVLENEESYRAWSRQMKGALEYATLWDVVSGTETIPASGPKEIQVWKRKDGAARTMILRGLSDQLALTVDSLSTANSYWTALETQFSRTSLKSAVIWIQNLVSPLSSIHALEAHIQAFQDAVGHIRSSGITIPEQFAARIFLSTLQDRDGEPTQWAAFVAKAALTDTTTLNETIADARNEHRRLLGNKSIPASSSGDTALSIELAHAAFEREAHSRGTKWCRYCTRDTHWTSECRTKGAGKQQGKGSGKQRGKKKKDRANVAQDDDDDSSDSAEEQSHFVRSERVLYTSFDQ